MEPALLGIAAAGRYLGHDGKSSGKTSIHKYLKEGKLDKVRLAGRTFVTRESADRLIAQSHETIPEVTE